MAKKPAPAVKKTASKKKAAPAKKAKPAKKSAGKAGAAPAGVNDRQHLNEIVRSTTGCTTKAAKEAVDGLIGAITSSLKKSGKFQLVGFGSFVVSKRAARMGRNPQTGAALKIKASKSVRFKAGKALKSAI